MIEFSTPDQTKTIDQMVLESQLQLWQAYCDKKMEVEDLKDEKELLLDAIRSVVEEGRFISGKDETTETQLKVYNLYLKYFG